MSCPSRAPRTAAAVVVAALSACSTYPERGSYEIDCSPREGVELSSLLFDFEPTGDPPRNAGEDWFAFGDQTPGAIPDAERVEGAAGGPAFVNPELDYPPAVPIDGGRCGSANALFIESRGHNDWGSGFGTWTLNDAARDASGWEGIALWARTEDVSDRSVLVLLTDRYAAPQGKVINPETSSLTNTCRPVPERCVERDGVPPTDEDVDGLINCADPDCCYPDSICGCTGGCEGVGRCAVETPMMTVCPRDAAGEIYCVDVPRFVEAQLSAATQSNEGQVLLGGSVADRYDCGNLFQLELTTSRFWQLYLLPFERFYQLPQPNRSPAGIDPSALHGFTIRTPREANIKLYLDDIGFYRHIRD